MILLHNRDSLPRGFTSHCGTSIWTTHSSQAQRQLSSIYRVKLKSQAAHLPSHGGGSDGREQRVGEVGDGHGDGGSKLGLCGHKHLPQQKHQYCLTVTLICTASCTVAPGVTMDSSSWMILLRLSTRVSRLGAGLGAAISCSQLHNTGL